MQLLLSKLSQKTTTRAVFAPLSQAGISAATTTMQMPLMRPSLFSANILGEDFSDVVPERQKSVSELRFPNEAKRPLIVTQLPGPAALAFKQTLGKYTCNLNT